MNARDELARIVDDVRDDPDRRDMSRIIEREHSMARFQGFGEWDQARLVAHHLHAAGYRKPRTINSLAELAALPAESAVQTSDTSDTVVLKGGDGLFINAFGGEVGADDLWRYGTKPFTVIYEPDPS